MISDRSPPLAPESEHAIELVVDAEFEKLVSTGVKFDAGKTRFSLILRGFNRWLLKVLDYGAEKYGVDNNWQHVLDARRRYYDALMRHIAAWWDGEWLDPESGLPHLAHAAACIAF